LQKSNYLTIFSGHWQYLASVR